MIFVTLSDGEYNDRWLSDTKNNTRLLQWCGQNCGVEDNLVVQGTQVWMRQTKKHKFFDHIGNIETIRMVEPNNQQRIGRKHATYHVLVNLCKIPVRIHRTIGDHCTHWAILRYIGIRPTGSLYFPRGIYAEASVVDVFTTIANEWFDIPDHDFNTYYTLGKYLS